MTAKSSRKKRQQPHEATPQKKQSKPWVAEEHHRLLHIAVFALGFIVCGFISLKLGQDNNWDLRNYHYYNPFAFLAGRIGFDFAPAQLQSYLNPLLDMPYYLGITYLPPKVFGFLMGGIHGLNIGLAFAISFLLLKRLSPNTRLGLSLLCAGLGAYAPIFAGELGASQNDILVSLLVLLPVYLFARALSRHDSLTDSAARGQVILASVIFGMAVGLKLTILIYALGAFAALMVIEESWLRRGQVFMIWSAAFLVGFLITNGFWMVKLYSQFGNPTFPFFNQIFESPWADPIAHSDERYLATSFMEGLLRPFGLAGDNHYTQTQNMARDGRYAVLYILLIVSVAVWFFRKQKSQNGKEQDAKEAGARFGFTRGELFLLVFFVVSYFVWQYKFSITRYTSVLEQVGPLLIVVLVFWLTRNGLLRAGLIAAAAMFILFSMHEVTHQRIPWRESFWRVNVPEVADPANTLILMANSRPWGYLVPLFPPEIRWVRVLSNFTEPGKPTKMQSEMRELLANYEGNMLLLSRSDPRVYSWIQHDAQVMAAYGLAVQDNPVPVQTEHSRPGMYLWPVVRGNQAGNAAGN